jgi:hypothetical protein
VQTGAPAPWRVGVAGQHRHATAAAAQADLDRLDHARRLGAGHPQAVGDHVQHLAAAGLTLAGDARVATRGQPLRLLLGRGVQGQLDGKREHQPRVARRRGTRDQVGMDGLRGVVPHRQRGPAVEQLRCTREQQLQVVVQLGHRADRAAAGAHRVGLVDGNRRRHAVDLVDRRPVHAVQELARVGAESLDVAPLALRVQRVEHQAGLSRATGPGDHGQLPGADVEVYALQVVLARTADPDHTVGHGSGGG